MIFMLKLHFNSKYFFSFLAKHLIQTFGIQLNIIAQYKEVIPILISL